MSSGRYACREIPDAGLREKRRGETRTEGGASPTARDQAIVRERETGSFEATQAGGCERRREEREIRRRAELRPEGARRRATLEHTPGDGKPGRANDVEERGLPRRIVRLEGARRSGSGGSGRDALQERLRPRLSGGAGDCQRREEQQQSKNVPGVAHELRELRMMPGRSLHLRRGPRRGAHSPSIHRGRRCRSRVAGWADSTVRLIRRQGLAALVRAAARGADLRGRGRSAYLSP